MALTKAQLLDRCNYLGGSDLAAVMGLSRYASPPDIYNDKVNPKSEDITNDAMERGNKLEPIILDWYDNDSLQNDIPRMTRDCDTFIHPVYPFLRANIDGYLDFGTVIEAKSVHSWSSTSKEFGQQNTDQIPTEYLIQCAYYAEIVPNIREVHIPVAFVKDNSGSAESVERFVDYIYQRNKSLGQSIIDAGVAFWNNHIIPRIPPAGESLRNKPKMKFNERAFKIDHPDLYNKYQIEVIKKEKKNEKTDS